jgi:hypothetical protein
MFIITYLEQSLALAWVSISNIFLPLQKCIFLYNLKVIEIYKPSEQHTCNKNSHAVTKTILIKQDSGWVQFNQINLEIVQLTPKFKKK